MPPRLLPKEYGFLDTVRHDNAQSIWMRGDVVNSLAAMPSMHFGESKDSWCRYEGLTLRLRIRFLHRLHYVVSFRHFQAQFDQRRGSQVYVLEMLLRVLRSRLSSNGAQCNCCYSESLLVGCIGGYNCCDFSVLLQQGVFDITAIGRLPNMGAEIGEANTEYRREIPSKRRKSVDIEHTIFRKH